METLEASGRSDPVIVCPSEDELREEPVMNVPCIVDGCKKIFNTTAARSIHIIQTHKIYKDEEEKMRFDRSVQKKMTKVIKHFYCPVNTCNRSKEWNKPFSRLSLLKQHYYIVHAEKKYPCPKCEKRFSTQSHLASHERDCGKDFFCTCGEKHKSSTSLYMHAKRKQHELPDEYRYNKRRKPAPEPPKETYILVVPVPCGNPSDFQKTICEPKTLLPHPSARTLLSLSGNSQLVNRTSATVTTPTQVGTATVGVGHNTLRKSSTSATASTQTDDSGVSPLPPKLSMNSSYAQTSHSCFPNFIPMLNGPRRHKKTLAVQTLGNWSQGQISNKMASTETQTLDGQGTTEQGPLSLGPQFAIPSRLPPQGKSISSPMFPQLSSPASLTAPEDASSCALMTSSLNSGIVNPQGTALETSQLDTNSTQTPLNVEAISNNATPDLTTTSVDPGNKVISPNEVRTQTDLTFQNFLEFNSSETQTLSSVNDAMTETIEPSSQTAGAKTGNPSGPNVATSATSMSPAPSSLGVEKKSTAVSPAGLSPGIQVNATGVIPVPLCLDVQTGPSSLSSESTGTRAQTSASSMTPVPMILGSSISPASLDLHSPVRSMGISPALQGLGDQASATSMSPTPGIALSGLELLFLASTEHRANSSLEMPRMDEPLCCQQTQTVFDADTGHQETQTAWDWSLDEFSFLDQYTQTAMSSSAGTSSNSSTTTMPETDQFSQTGIDLYSQFAFSNTETQTVSVFDLEMFGNSISVQTEAGSGSKLLEGDGLNEITKEVQVSTLESQQERVSADVQTEDLDFDRLRSRQMGSGQLASSHTQTSLWEDIESIIRSDSFTQTQFP
nr:ATM interactor-like [Lytechinus pictus]